MANGIKEYDDQDTKYNPAEALSAGEQAALDQIEASLKDDGFTGLDENPSDKVAQKEATPPTIDYERSQKNRVKSQAVKGFMKWKKAGPIGAIIAAIAGVGSLSPLLVGILPINVKEVLVDKFNDQLAVMDIRSTVITKNRIGNKTTSGICSPVTIRCKYRTMSSRQLNKLQKAGFKIEHEKTSLGRIKPKSFEFDGKSISAANLYREASSNPSLKAALLKGYNPKYSAFTDSLHLKMTNRLRIMRGKIFTSTDPKKMRTDLTDSVSGRAHQLKVLGLTATEGDDGKTHYTDHKGNPIDSAKAQDLIEKANSLDPESIAKARLGGAGSQVAKSTIKGVLTSTALGLGAVDTMCTGYNLVRTVGSAAKYIGALQLMRYFSVFANTADRVKSGDATPEEVEFIGNMLTSVNSQGKSGTDSYGYQYAAYGTVNSVGIPKISSTITPSENSGSLSEEEANEILVADEVLKYRNGQIAGNDFMTSIVGLVDGGGTTTDNADSVCDFMKSGWGQGILITTAVGGAVVAFFSGGLSVGWGTVAQAAAMVGLGAAIALLTPKLIEMTAGTIIAGDENGNQAMNAIVSGAGVYNAQASQSRGLAPLSKEDAIIYQEKTSNTLKTYAAAERTELSPFDITSRNTFFGSMVHTILPYATNSTSSLPTKFVGIIKNSLLSPLKKSTAYADSVNEFNICQDSDYEKYNLAADPFCNIRYGLDTQALNTDPDVILDYMDPYINEEGAPKDDNNDYAKFIKNCIERTSPIAAYTEEDGQDEGIDCIQGASGDPEKEKKHTMFRLFFIDQSIIEGMDEEPISTGTVEDGSSPEAILPTEGGDIAWPLNKELYSKKKSVFLKGHGTSSGTFVKPGGKTGRAADLGANSLGVSEGEPIYATLGGKVTKVAGGHAIIIRSNVPGGTVDIAYAHGHTKVKVGDTVVAGQQISGIGNLGKSYGAHLHIDMNYNQQQFCPQDLFIFMNDNPGKLPDFPSLVSKAKGGSCSRL